MTLTNVLRDIVIPVLTFVTWAATAYFGAVMFISEQYGPAICFLLCALAFSIFVVYDIVRLVTKIKNS